MRDQLHPVAADGGRAMPEEIVKAIEELMRQSRGWYCAPEAWEVVQAKEALTTSILSRLTAAEAGREEALRWQPIETAPKDNEDSILVCDARVVGGFHQVVWWSEGPKATGYNWYTSDGPNFHRDAFTHWMPLPKEPDLTEAGRHALKDA